MVCGQHQQHRIGGSFQGMQSRQGNSGAVFLPTGSRMMLASSWPIVRICSAARKRCSSLQISKGAATSKLAKRCTVACSIVGWPGTKDKNCLGYCWRDSGHRREPEPPAMMMGITLNITPRFLNLIHLLRLILNRKFHFPCKLRSTFSTGSITIFRRHKFGF